MASATSSSVSRPRRRVPRALIATLGHELRTPLTSIRGYLETLLESELDPPTARRFLETARREALRLDRMVDGMLQLTVHDAAIAGGANDPASCDVSAAIGETLEMLAPVARLRSVAIRRHVPERAIARIARDACVRVLANLLENAIKHGAEGGAVEIACATERRAVVVTVDDNGEGVAEEARGAIFAYGVRAGAPSRPGNGIGLTVVKRICERNGGTVAVERSALGGARFVVSLPAG